MERPSHIDITSHQSLLQRLPLIALAGGLQVALFWLFTQGLATKAIHDIIHTIELTPFVETKTPPPPPPTPTIKDPPRVVVDLPVFTTRQEGGDRTITATTTPPTTTTVSNPLPERAPVAIASTHTTPPYPVVARRAGWEGNVTLRLTVLTDGHVGKADVVTSSGREILDEAAQAWIVAHWAFKPALADGVPAVSHTTALVTFSLENGR